MDSNTEIDYHKHNAVYISDYIKFVDAKAGIAFGLNIALVGLFAKTLKESWTITALKLSDLLLIFSLLSLLISLYFILWKVLWPRYVKNTQFYHSWGGIASFPHIDDYYTHLKQQPEGKFLKDLAAQNYSLAQVSVKKYQHFERAVIFLTAGGILGVAGWLFI
ncbi:Pycsar system effector family protein [Paenibacillus amylolyticus]|uniref:Pycsar system effector family protein n=1 Tax=Paenibacillus amylolyticus TaxID=1451 RepID=UPI003241DFBA